MAKKIRKRGPTLEDKYIGLKPSYGDHNPVPTDPNEIIKEWRRGTYWFYYKQNKNQHDNEAHKQILLDFITKKDAFRMTNFSKDF